MVIEFPERNLSIKNLTNWQQQLTLYQTVSLLYGEKIVTTKGNKTRDSILKTTRELYVKKGFQNTSISEVISATGVKKGNLYYHFESKEALGLAVLIDAKTEFLELIPRSFKGKTPIQKIKNSIKTIFEMMEKTNFVGGCLFGNTALEMSDNNPRFSCIIKEVFTNWWGLIEEQLIEAQMLGFLDKTLSTTKIAKLIIASIEGGIMLSRVSKNKNDFEDCMEALEIYLVSYQ